MLQCYNFVTIINLMIVNKHLHFHNRRHIVKHRFSCCYAYTHELDLQLARVMAKDFAEFPVVFKKPKTDWLTDWLTDWQQLCRYFFREIVMNKNASESPEKKRSRFIELSHFCGWSTFFYDIVANYLPWMVSKSRRFKCLDSEKNRKTPVKWIRVHFLGSLDRSMNISRGNLNPLKFDALFALK